MNTETKIVIETNVKTMGIRETLYETYPEGEHFVADMAHRSLPIPDVKRVNLTRFVHNVTTTNMDEINHKFPTLGEHFQLVRVDRKNRPAPQYMCCLEVELTPVIAEVLQMHNDQVELNHRVKLNRAYKQHETERLMWSQQKAKLDDRLAQLRSFWIVRLIEKFFI